ncbi:SPFH domain-containing protein [Streptomyces misionensis]|uniref:SPFH domain-containing protein n=1 Tax=Streptomyces misionensis TaxID=67331 RepID=UPI0036CFC69C
MTQELVGAIVALICVALVYMGMAARVVKQYERGVLFRLGRVAGDVRPPGLTLILPFVDRLQKVNMQIVTLPIPAQEGITRDNVTVRVDAVVYFRVVDATSALVKVEDYKFAVSQMAQTSLRSIIGKSDLDDLLSNREKLNQGLELMIDSPAVGWGIQVDRVEIKDVSLPDTMKRSMARQAEADRERRARIINADAELQASKKLAEAAEQMSGTPAALQLRLLQTVMAVSAEKNSTLVLPIPVELLHFLERGNREPAPSGQSAARAEPVPLTPDGAEPDPREKVSDGEAGAVPGLRLAPPTGGPDLEQAPPVTAPNGDPAAHPGLRLDPPVGAPDLEPGLRHGAPDAGPGRRPDQ